jgi:hypothetical protein
VLLDVDFLLELCAVAHFHKFMSVAGIAVAAAELAATVRVDGPGERHSSLAVATIQQGFRGESEVFDFVSLAQGLALRGQPGDADERGFLGEREQGKRGHIRLLFAYDKLSDGGVSRVGITEKGVTGVAPSAWERFPERVTRLYEQDAPSEQIQDEGGSAP